MGTRQYAKKIAEIIDKNNEYFREHRIVSRDDCAGTFSMDQY
jgi:TFIIF-interacting CTD phosphatase-like protein